MKGTTGVLPNSVTALKLSTLISCTDFKATLNVRRLCSASVIIPEQKSTENSLRWLGQQKKKNENGEEAAALAVSLHRDARGVKRDICPSSRVVCCASEGERRRLLSTAVGAIKVRSVFISTACMRGRKQLASPRSRRFPLLYYRKKKNLCHTMRRGPRRMPVSDASTSLLFRLQHFCCLFDARKRFVCAKIKAYAASWADRGARFKLKLKKVK